MSCNSDEARNYNIFLPAKSNHYSSTLSLKTKQNQSQVQLEWKVGEKRDSSMNKLGPIGYQMLTCLCVTRVCVKYII